jgi:hypothetical protein
MIPREILKKIRQIEIRTNRVVTGFSERGCPSRSTSIAVGDSETFHARCARERAAGETPALRFNRATYPDRCARLEFRVYAARDEEAADCLKAELRTACGARANSSFIVHHSAFA